MNIGDVNFGRIIKVLAATLVGVLAWEAIAVAAYPGGYPTNNIVSPNGTEAINASGPSLLSQVFIDQLRDSVGYSKQSPSTGSTLTFAYGQSQMQIGGSSTIAALTVNLSASPADGQMNCLYTKPAITSLTLSVSAGQTINDAVTAGSATTKYCYLYSASNSTWDRVQ